MPVADRRLREREEQRRLITASARALADRDGWDAVTTRRLSAEIEYSQPVIYKHFASMEDLVGAVATEGFAELAEALAAARQGTAADGALGAVARAYTRFAAENPALYDAMFGRVTGLHFGPGSAAPLQAAFGELRAAVATTAGARDPDTLAEVTWAALHGLTTLGRGARLRPDHEDERIDLLVAQVAGSGSHLPWRP